MAYPIDKTAWVDGVTELDAWWFNAIEDYIGVVGSTEPASLTYKLTNPEQEDPGHRHTAAAFNGGNDGDVFGRAGGAWAPKTPDAAGLVAKTGDQSIAGKKTFTTIPEGPNADPTTGNQLTRKSYVDAGIAAEANARAAADTAEANARAAADAAHDTAIAGKVAKAGDTMTGDLGFDGETADLSDPTGAAQHRGLGWPEPHPGGRGRHDRGHQQSRGHLEAATRRFHRLRRKRRGGLRLPGRISGRKR